MKRLEKYPFLIRVIKQWPDRLKKAGIRQNELATLTDISEVTISNTITLKNKNPKLSTIKRIEDVLHSKGV
tara:strand:- start:506 stop:718 length:213 start_codon:yes stop_codon:yes gene_type:complete